MRRTFIALLLALVGFAHSFSVKPSPKLLAPKKLVHVPTQRNRFVEAAAAAAAVLSTTPLVAIAEEVDEYEYGAVNAPIGLAWGAGVLAILTALLPLALQGGEEAFEEMRMKDEDKWGN